MSTRAIRALRGEKADLDILDSVQESSDHDEDEFSSPKPSAFALMNDSSSEDEDESSQEETLEAVDNDDVKPPPTIVKEPPITAQEEDLDALLTEFHDRDAAATIVDKETITEEPSTCAFDFILQNLDTRDFDYDHGMRISLMHESNGGSRSNRKSFLFGPMREGWIRPPRLVGGGIGMTSYDREPRDIPWPYSILESVEATLAVPNHRWCTFVHSDSYTRDLSNYVSTIQPSGDLNALVMFIAHHPYVNPAILQLSDALYMNQLPQDGLGLLRRSLWVYESSSLISFQNQIASGRACLLDYKQFENAPFFKALFRLMHVSYIAGLSRTAMAIGRLLLSMDPLRDPMGVLLSLDHHTLNSSLGSNDTDKGLFLDWIIDLVVNQLVDLWFIDGETTYRGRLRDLPNWSYSYSLALFHKSQEEESDEARACASEALREAISKFPSVVPLLLQSLEVDTTGRSFQRDWVTVLDYAIHRARDLQREWRATTSDLVVLSATLQTTEKLIRIFVKQSSSLWGGDAVLQWLFDNLKQMQTLQLPLPDTPPTPAVMRYADVNPSDYDSTIQTLPAEANVINPGLVAHAMVMDPRRPRFLRRANNRQADVLNDPAVPGAATAGGGLFGPPTNHVDPDWPLVEVFWRSFLPWNHVDGVPPPRR